MKNYIRTEIQLKYIFFLIFKIYSLLTSWAGQFRYQMKTTNTEKTYIQHNDTMFGQIGRVDQEKLSETISEPKKN